MKKPLSLTIVVIGAGAAGCRFISALEHLVTQAPASGVTIAVVDRDPARLIRWKDHYFCFTSLEEALGLLVPEAAVVAVNESEHFAVLQTLANTSVQKILCEKPLVETLEQACQIQSQLESKALTLNLVERMSPLVPKLRSWLLDHPELRTERVEFFWGKNRLFDGRPTMGILSEIIHPLDLVSYMFGMPAVKITQAVATNAILERNLPPVMASVDIAGHGASTIIIGHASFLWHHRHREVLGFMSDGSETFRARLLFDEPVWDSDSLIIEQISQDGKPREVLRYEQTPADFAPALVNIHKVYRFVYASLFPESRCQVVQLAEAVALQQTLDEIKQLTDHHSPQR